jgi:hypothetical protein
MSSRQAYPALPPKLTATCEGCKVPYRRVVGFHGNSRIVVKHRLKLVLVNGLLARLCDKCRKLMREHGRVAA